VLRRASDGLWKNAQLAYSDLSGAPTPVTSVTATGLLTSSGGTTPQISTSIATNSLAGRFTAGTGALEAITIGSGLAIVGGALVVTAGGTGTVTSVGLSLPAIFSVTGSPVTTSGTLAATLATQAANLVFAGPSSGAAAAPTFRQLGYSELSGLPTLGGAAALNVGTTAGTVAAGDDSRLTTDLAYTASTRLLSSSTGADATLPLFSGTDAGLVPASGGGTTNFLRADGTFAAPPGGGGGGVTFTVYATGNYIQPVQGTLSAGVAMVANNIYLYPFFVLRTLTVDNLGARVTSASAGSNVQLAIYNSTTNGVPTTLLASTASLSAGATGTVNAAVTAFTLNAGQMYWMAMNSDGAPTMVGIAPTSNYYTTIFGSTSLGDVSSASGVPVGRAVAQTYGTWPDLTSISTTIDTGRRGGLVWLKVATLP
jgi:hypothetical protein